MKARLIIPNQKVCGGKKQMNQPAKSTGFKGRVKDTASNRIENGAVVSVNCNNGRAPATTRKLKLTDDPIHIDGRKKKNNKRMKKQRNDSPSKTTMKGFIRGGSSSNNIVHHLPNCTSTSTRRLRDKDNEEGRVNSNDISNSTRKRGSNVSGNSSIIETKAQNWQSSKKCEEMGKAVKTVGVKIAKKGFMYDIVYVESKRCCEKLMEEANGNSSCNSTLRARVIALKEANNGELGLSSDVLTPRLSLKDRSGNRGPLPSDYSPYKRQDLVVDALERGDVCDALRVSISQKTGSVDLPDNEIAKQIKVMRKEWCLNLSIGVDLEYRYNKDGKWYRTKIVERNGRSGRIKLHFVGWPSKYDMWVTLQALYRNFVPIHTFTRPRTYKKKWHPKPRMEKEWVLEDSNGRVLDRAETNTLLRDTTRNATEGLGLPEKPMGLSLRSRGICTTAPPLSHKNKINSRLIAETTDDEGSSRVAEEEDTTQALSVLRDDSPGDGDTIGSSSLTDTDENDWHCSICMQISMPTSGLLVDKTELVCCDGPCLRSFHMGCLEMVDNGHELFLNQAWLCDMCTARSGPCFLCNVKDEKVKPCEAKQCGRFFHTICLKQFNGGGRNSKITEVSSSTSEKKCCDIGSLMCGYHSCKGCGKKGERVDFLRCLLCPVAYHPNCVPASMPKLLEAKLLMCPAHPGSSLPELPAELNGEIDGTKALFSWHEALPLPATVPSLNAPCHDLRHFRLPMSFLEEYRGSTRPNRITPDGSCVCVPKKGGGGCDELCLNRLLHVECYGLDSKKGKKTSPTSISYTHANCPIGEKCRNRRMQQPKSSLPRTEVFAEFERGLGVRAIDLIPKDTFIFEYVGEVIEEAEMERRLRAQHQLRPNDSDHYIMELQSGLYVDAKHFGNTSRFINHSCNPNCVVERWTIGPSDQRIGIFVKKTIKPGEALSYDYSFCTNDASAFICKCNSDNCRGTLAAKKQVKDKIDPETLSAPERKEYLKREKKKKEGQKRRDKQRLWMTGRLLPGDGMEEVKDGPTCKIFGYCRLKRIFLPCNAMRGMNMIARRQRLVK